jgi:general stress protein YciG
MKKKQGFAAMSKDRQREIASLGGRSIPAEKRSFSTNRELARTAGSKGGSANARPAIVR